MLAAARTVPPRNTRGIGFILLLFGSLLALLAALALEFAAQWQTGLRPSASGYGAMVYLNMFLLLQLALALAVMTGFVIARSLCRRLDNVRRVTFDNLALLHYYAIGQGLLGALVVHGFPRLMAG